MTMDDEKLMFVEVRGSTMAGKWIECKQLPTVQLQMPLLWHKVLSVVSNT